MGASIALAPWPRKTFKVRNGGCGTRLATAFAVARLRQSSPKTPFRTSNSGPMSLGQHLRQVVAMFITNKPIRLEDFFAQKTDPSCGAVASFVGVVRNHHQGRSVAKIYYDCYPTMANQQIQQIIHQAKKKYPVNEIRALHRVGWLGVGEVAVAIAVSAAHREEAFSACRTVIEEIKAKVPIWKKEVYVDGSDEWVMGSCAVEEGA